MNHHKIENISISDFSPLPAMLAETTASADITNTGTNKIQGLVVIMNFLDSNNNGFKGITIRSLDVGETKRVNVPFWWSINPQIRTPDVTFEVLLDGYLIASA